MPAEAIHLVGVGDGDETRFEQHCNREGLHEMVSPAVQVEAVQRLEESKIILV